MTEQPSTAAPVDRAGRPGGVVPVALALVGAAAGLAVVVGGQPPDESAAGVSIRWPLLDVHALPAGLRTAGPALALAGVTVLVGCWLWLWRRAAGGRLPGRGLVAVAACWAAPFAVGPPVLSTDVWSYLAQGKLLRAGLNPYRVGPAALGSLPLVQNVHPAWRTAPSPYGPLALGLFRVAAGAGGPVLGVLLLRLFACVGVLVAAVAVAVAAGRVHRVAAVALLAANPLVVVHLVGGGHVDGVLAGLLAAAVLARLRQRPTLAVVLASAAGMVKAQGFVLVAALLVDGALAGAPADRLRRTARGVVAAAGTVLLAGWAVPDGWGWLSRLGTPGRSPTYDAPTNLAGWAVHQLTGVSSGTALGVCRVAGLVVAGLLSTWLLATVRRRGPVRTAGEVLLVLVVFGPVLYAWYLVAPLACLAAVADRRWRYPLLMLSGALSLTSLPPFRGLPTGVAVGSWLVAVGAVAATVVAARSAGGRPGRAGASAPA